MTKNHVKCVQTLEKEFEEPVRKSNQMQRKYIIYMPLRRDEDGFRNDSNPICVCTQYTGLSLSAQVKFDYLTTKPQGERGGGRGIGSESQLHS